MNPKELYKNRLWIQTEALIFESPTNVGPEYFGKAVPTNLLFSSSVDQYCGLPVGKYSYEVHESNQVLICKLIKEK